MFFRSYACEWNADTTTSGLGAGLGDTEFSVTAYPGICAADQDCWGNPRGQVHQWFYTSDTSYHASVIHGGKLMTRDHFRPPRNLRLLTYSGVDKPEPWDFSKRPAADIVVINIGTNDNNQANNVSTAAYIDALTKIIQGVHGKWPKAQVIVMVSFGVPNLTAPEFELTQLSLSHSGSAFTSPATRIYPTRPRAG